MEADGDFGGRMTGGEVDDGNGAFVGDEADGIDADFAVSSDRAGEARFIGPAAAPVADIQLVLGEHEIEGGVADVEGAEEIAGGGVEFADAIGDVQGDVESRAVGRRREAGGDLVNLVTEACWRKVD